MSTQIAYKFNLVYSEKTKAKKMTFYRGPFFFGPLRKFLNPKENNSPPDPLYHPIFFSESFSTIKFGMVAKKLNLQI